MKGTQIICIDESYSKCVCKYGAHFSHGFVNLHVASVSCMNLKPSNLLLDPRGGAVVSDFGLLETLKKPQ